MILYVMWQLVVVCVYGKSEKFQFIQKSDIMFRLKLLQKMLIYSAKIIL
jgi:hypothetical protein